MEELFKNYKKILEERLQTKPLLHLGEDSIRYDFFASLMETYKFRPCQIQLEVAINDQTFIPARERISMRNEKPLIDLVVIEKELQISVEFGLFRQNSNEKGTIGKTNRFVKMFNDMIRVSLEANYTYTKGLFICVADHKMLGHQLRNKRFDPFPCEEYLITNEFINYQLEQRTNKLDRRFLKVFQPMERIIKSKLIFNELLFAKNVLKETRLLIWEVKLETPESLVL